MGTRKESMRQFFTICKSTKRLRTQSVDCSHLRFHGNRLPIDNHGINTTLGSNPYIDYVSLPILLCSRFSCKIANTKRKAANGVRPCWWNPPIRFYLLKIIIAVSTNSRKPCVSPQCIGSKSAII